MHSINEGKRGEAAPRQLSGRGLSYWSDGKEERVIYVTPGYQMVALDAKTGQRVPGFGTDGIVDLKTGLDQEGLDLTTAEIGLHSAPIISKDIIVVGAAHREGGFPKSKTNVKGYIRGFDVRTGKRVWVFHTIPMKGEAGLRDVGSGRGVIHRQRRRVGADERRRRARHRLHAGGTADRRLLRRPSPRHGEGTGSRLCTARAWSRSTSRPARRNGTTSSCTTASGITTFRARRS